ncbi:glycine--tRNA ligase subunit beta [Methylophaga sp.]|jgi:glycyl-tRNA synthetase beta chain|uniref:glycine--tRNA ligase subunit beta n=1 Tax=Methylophaga sp. TaxID=2024840 RepID=UPI001400CD30|nr:glycine--tRNA ligase subunit beta [Methylophaga sp.]MTI63633.1 glycine--tRNA ligase subunit beta [Methylophaga sp.]
MKEFDDLLIELGTEELPPKALAKLSQAFHQGVEQGLKKAELKFDDIRPYATPRRLALVISKLQTKQPDRVVERRGPAVTAAFDEDGNPTKALLGFAGSCGVEVDDLDTMKTDKGAWLVFKQEQAGAAAADLLPDIIQQALNDLPIPKRMRWGDLPGEFVRPVHWLIVLLGDEVVPMDLLGVSADRFTRGHRFHYPQPIRISSPMTYAPQLESEGHVMVDFEARKEAIEGQVKELADKLKGRAIINPDLLDEVTGLVEWPVALAGNFDLRFLELPPEALISSMEGHQKYFAVEAKDGKLLPHFITVSNIASQDPAQVIAGNERVILPRLSDAAFFWDTDRKRPLAEHQEQLKTIVFQNKLGSVYDKSQRVASLAAEIAGQIAGQPKLAERAAKLAKCDLVTEMVGEFPELQGIMGRYYARLDGEDNEVAEALDEQYQPRFAGDALPATRTGQAVSLAEKLDTLTGLFGIGQPPSGVKDPFALRRAALGVLRIMIEKSLDLDLTQLLQKAVANFDGTLTEKAVSDQVMQYFYDRLRGYALEQGFKADEFEAVLTVKPTRPLDFMQRLKAVAAFRKLEQAESLAAANKRIANILRKNEAETADPVVKDNLLQETAEKALAEKVSEARQKLAPLSAKADYAGVLNYLAGMRETVDSFFDDVMVMADDEAVRHNRLALLNQTRALFLGVADISCLQE